MTTTTQPPTETPTPDPHMCPKCGIALKRVEGTNVENCNTCGYIGGEPTSDGTQEVPRGTTEPPVQPDEVLGAGEHKAEQPAAEEPPPLDQNAELERAVENALSMPGVPGRDEFLTLAQTARMLSMSPLVPKFLRGNPAACFHLAMIGRDLGISPTSAVELIDIMPVDRNKNTTTGRPMLSPELLNGQIIRLGLGSIAPLCKRPDLCIAVALAPGGALDRKCVRIGRHFYSTPADYVDMGFPEGADHPDLGVCGCHGIIGETVFDWTKAIVAELVGPLCTVGDHKKVSKSRQDGSSYSTCGCNQGYITYPDQMMWWRAAGFCQAENFPQASLGLYTAEAMGALVDSSGRMIDPTTVALPEGFDDTTTPPASRGSAAPATDARPPADPVDIHNVNGRIRDLPPEQQTSLKGLWAEKQREQRVEPVARLTTVGIRVAHALLDTAEREARAKGWVPTFVPMEKGAEGEAGETTGEAPDSAPVAAETPGAPDAATEPAPAAGGDSGAAPANMAPDLKAQHAKPAPVLTTDLLESSITIVSQMTPRALNDALRQRGMATGDDADVRRRNLAKAMAQEAAQQDWDAANKPAEG